MRRPADEPEEENEDDQKDDASKKDEDDGVNLRNFAGVGVLRLLLDDITGGPAFGTLEGARALVAVELREAFPRGRRFRAGGAEQVGVVARSGGESGVEGGAGGAKDGGGLKGEFGVATIMRVTGGALDEVNRAGARGARRGRS